MKAVNRNAAIVAAAFAVAAIVVVGTWGEDLVSDASGAETATEAEVLDRSIADLADRYRADPYNYVLGARLSDLYRQRFRAEAELRDLDRAAEVARRVLRTSPDSAAAYARLSMLALSRHDFRGAYEHARLAAEADPDDAGALAVLFDAAAAIGRTAVAESALTRMPGSSIGYRFREARWQAERGQPRSAARNHREACESLAERPSTNQVRAWCLTGLAGLELELRGPAAARERLEEALDVRPGYRGAIEGLADLAYAERRWDRAEELYRRILADAHPDLYLRLAEVLEARGEHEASRRFERRFERVATAEGRESLFARPLAYYYARREATHEEALDLARADRDRRPTSESYETLAWVHLQRGEPQRALAMSDSARAEGDPGATSDYHRARILRELGRTDAAERLAASVEAAEPALLVHHVLRAMRLADERGRLVRRLQDSLRERTYRVSMMWFSTIVGANPGSSTGGA